MIEPTPDQPKPPQGLPAQTPAQKIANLAKFKGVIREMKQVIAESKATRGRQTSVMLFDGETTIVLMALDSPSFLANGLMTQEGIGEFVEAGAEAIAKAYKLSPRRAPSVPSGDGAVGSEPANAEDIELIEAVEAANRDKSEEAKSEEKDPGVDYDAEPTA